MRVSCLQENLNRGLGIVGRVIPKGKASNPIIQNVLLETDGNQLLLQGTDLVTTASVGLDSAVSEPGKALVPYQLLSDVVQPLARDRVDLTIDGTSLLLQCGSSKVKLRTPAVDSYPVMPVEQESETIFIEATELRRALSVQFAAAKGPARPMLAGIHLDLQGEHPVMAATNGFALAVCTLKVPRAASGRLIIPREPLSALQPLLNEEGVTVAIGIGASRVSFLVHSVLITSALLQGEYPKYQGVIPSNTQCSIEVDRASLLGAVRCAMVLTEQRKMVKMTASAGTLTLDSYSKEAGEYKSALPAEVQGEGGVTLNGEDLAEALQNMAALRVRLEVGGAVDPVVVREEDFLVVLMPFVSSE